MESIKAVITHFHIPPVPEAEYDWVSTKPELFEGFIQYLKGNGFKAIVLRDDPAK